MSSLYTPQSSKSSSKYGSSSLRSLRMTDLSDSKERFGNHDHSAFLQSIINKHTEESEFTSQFSTSATEIDNARYEIQNLMTKAHAYCKNSGLGNTSYALPLTPPRYIGVSTPRQSKFQVTPTHQGEFFRSTITRDLTRKEA